MCKANTNAYLIPETGQFHICPKGLDLKLNGDIECTDLDASCSSKMRSLPMTLLHEMTHFEDIGADAHANERIIDLKSGAYDCFKLTDEQKRGNAQNYAWFAGEAFWSVQCDRTFNDPAPGVQ